MDLLPPTDVAPLLYLAAFSVLSISCIVILSTSSSHPNPGPTPLTHLIYPISSCPAEELNAYTHFINYYSISQQVSDLENQLNSYHSDHPSNPPLEKPKLDQAFSQVTLTFGSDKPEVYMKMAALAHHKLLCRCPCNHQSPELAPFPHISHTSTISTDLSAHNPTFDSDSLSTFASNKLLTPACNQPSSPQQTPESDSPVSPSTQASPNTTTNHTWLVITDTASANSIAPSSDVVPNTTTHHLIARNDLTCRIAYTRMKTMIPFIDPAIFIQWITLKIFISLYVFARGVYDQALRNPVTRIFKE